MIPKNLEKISNFEGWDLILVFYKRNKHDIRSTDFGVKYSTKKYLSKFMWVNLRDFMIVNLTENKLINWDWLGIHYVAEKKPPSENVQLWEYLAKKLSFIYIWVSTISFSFQSYFGRLSHGVSFPPKLWEGDFSPKNAFHGGTNFVGKIYRGIVLFGRTNDQIIPRGKQFHRMYFPVVWTL